MCGIGFQKAGTGSELRACQAEHVRSGCVARRRQGPRPSPGRRNSRMALVATHGQVVYSLLPQAAAEAVPAARADEAASCEGAPQDREPAQELASPREPQAGGEGGNRRGRGAEREGDGALREGHGRDARHDGDPEVGHKPRHPGHGLDGAQADAGTQGREPDPGSGEGLEPDMPRVRGGGSRQPQNSGRLHLRALRARGTCRHQRGKEHPVRGAWPRPGARGVRDWRVRTARGVRVADLIDP